MRVRARVRARARARVSLVRVRVGVRVRARVSSWLPMRLKYVGVVSKLGLESGFELGLHLHTIYIYQHFEQITLTLT